MAEIKKIMTTAAANIKAVFGVAKASIKKVGSGGTMPAAGGGTFKSLMADLGAGPTYEFLFNAVDGSGDMVNTGTVGSGANANDDGSYAVGQPLSVSTTADEFDGASLIAGAAYTNWSTSVAQSTVVTNTDRSFVFVWETTDTAGAWNKSVINFIAEGGSPVLGIGSIKSGGAAAAYWTQGGTAAKVLSAAEGTHTAAGSATDLLGATSKRNVLIITYDHGAGSGAGLFTWRWKQTGDGSGHTYATGEQSTAATPSGNTTILWAGIVTTDWTANINYRYTAVIDHVITESEADSLFDVAGL